MKYILVIALFTVSLSTFAQGSASASSEAGISDQKKKLMIKQIQIIKSIQSQLTKFLK